MKITFETEGDECTLDECPPGLFLFDGQYIGFKTEYCTEKLEDGRTIGLQCDAYVVASGEYFWGGASNWRDRAKLLVRPLEQQD